MSNEILRSEPNQLPSFEEFKETIFQQDTGANFLNKVANLYGRTPRLIRILNNFDPSGTLSAIDQLFSEKINEQEQDKILRAIYNLAIKIWNVENKAFPNLPDEKFKFLYLVYIKAATDKFARVETDEIQKALSLSQQRTISVGQYLDQNGLIKFNTWVEGIKINHDGIVRVEADLLGNNKLPKYVRENEVKKIEERIRLRFALLQLLYKETEGDTSKKILHDDLAKKSGIDHDCVISQLLPYMAEEGWIIFRTNDSVTITEAGIDRVKVLLK